MFRITSCINTSRRLLFRRPRLDIQLVPISRTVPTLKYTKRIQERDPCPIPPPPPPPPPKDDKAFWGAVTLLFFAAGFVAYAKTDPEIRDWLSIHAPWIDDLIAIAHQENMTYREFLQHCVDELKNYINSFTELPKECIEEEQPDLVIIEPGVQNALPEKEKEVVKEIHVQEDIEPCDRLLPPIMTKDICEIELCLKDLGETAILNYMTARDACIYYNQLVQETMEKFTVAGLKALRNATEERNRLVKEHVSNATNATSKLDEVHRYFGCDLQASKQAIQNAKDLLKEYSDKVTHMKMQWQWENDKSLVMDTQWRKVEDFINKFIEENKTMFKNLDYEIETPQLIGDADLLLHHSLRYVEQLQEELADAMASMTDRVNRGLDTLPHGKKEVQDRNAEIEAQFNKSLGDMKLELIQRFNDKKVENDRILRESLRESLEKCEDTLALRLAQKEIEATEKLDEMVAEKVAADREFMDNELANMAENVQLIEDRLNERLKAERETRRSQELWLAGASLLAATQKGDPYVKVDEELKAIEKASGDGDQLVITVLKAIPTSVREQGVVPESVLKEKYRVMEDVALKVALVEEEGAPLLIYILSYIQSMFLFMKLSGIPQAEFDKPPKEACKDLDTFDLLRRARFWMDNGNVALALKYVAALSGASGAAASSWHEAARSHLETRQAAEAIIAHAAALGLQYI